MKERSGKKCFRYPAEETLIFRVITATVLHRIFVSFMYGEIDSMGRFLNHWKLSIFFMYIGKHVMSLMRYIDKFVKGKN